MDHLESRCLLAGNVTVSVVDGDLVISGDTASNMLMLDQRGLPAGSVRVSPFATSINQDSTRREQVFTGVTGGIRITTGGGDDRIALHDIAVAGPLSIHGATGKESTLLSNVRIAGPIAVDLEGGADAFHAYDSTFSGPVQIATGSRPDVVALNGNSFAGGVLVRTYRGRDSIAIAHNTFAEKPKLRTGPDGGRITTSGTIRSHFDFGNGTEGWASGFADYSSLTTWPVPTEPATFYKIRAELRPMPEELGLSGTGYFLSGFNHSDDLFMFLKRKLGKADGVVPGRTYDVAITVSYATDTAHGMMGAGGAPGEAVGMKAGASAKEPIAVETAPHQWRLNIDMGMQSNDGLNGLVIGDMTNGLQFGGHEDPVWRLQTRSATRVARVTAGRNGEIWICVGTDSGFEGTTDVYYKSIDVALVPVAGAG